MAENKTTFWNFLKENEIEIPIIQRDYAQGRIGKEYLRQSFLSNLKDALDSKNDETELKLDFVYGSVENETLQPLDGQQRLTTLWLLHWYIAMRTGKLKDAGETLKRFTYETRISSREFCEHLCNGNYFEFFINSNEDERIGIVEFITNQTWFYSAWKQDPTIQSMLRMLGGTKIRNKKGEDIIDGIEEIFVNVSLEEMESYWTKLTTNSPIVFYYLPLKEFGLSDDLYIKMNARGKQLTMFENFKADLIGFIQEQADSELDNRQWKNLMNESNGIPIKMDTTWTDIFWRNKSESKRIDEIYFAFLNRYILNQLILGLGSAEEIKENKTFTCLYGNQGNDTALEYTTFEVYKIQSLEIVLDNLRTTLENFHSFVSQRENQRLEDIQKKFFPLWNEKDDFRFIPEYKDNSITILKQPQRVVFHAICRYFEQGEYEERSFKEWMRVVWNLVENSNINTIESMIGSLRLIDELGEYSHDIYNFLAGEKSIKSNVALEQQNEEREKAKKIIEDINWENKIISSEKYAFFNGAIRFMFRDENGNWNWNSFDKKSYNAFQYFNPDGAYKKDSLLLRYFISRFTDWSLFWGMTFDNDENSWRSLLLDNKWKRPVHEILVADNIEVDTDYHSSLMNLEAKVQEELVTTRLLEHIEKGCYLNWKYDNYVLYPYNVKADWKKYIIANNRNNMLSLLYGGTISCNDKQDGRIYTNQRLNGCDYFWGRNIWFTYMYESVLYEFSWQSWKWIDMYEGNIRLIDMKTPFTDNLTIDGNKIIAPEDLIMEMERCITEYKEFKKMVY